MHRGRYRDALRVLEQEQSPGTGETVLVRRRDVTRNMGECHESLGELNEAIRLYRETLANRVAKLLLKR